MINERERRMQEEVTSWRAQRRKGFLESIKPYATSPIVYQAFGKVDRYDFVPDDQKTGEAYYVRSIICLGKNSSISMPLLTAEMMRQLDLTGRERVLEIGTASGYSAALLSCCSQRVYTVELNPELAASAQKRLRKLGFNNVEVYTGDGLLGLPEHAPFDAIFVTGAARRIPRALRNQLAEGGRMVIPVGSDNWDLYLIKAVKVKGRLVPKVIFKKGDKSSLNFFRLISSAHGGWNSRED